MKRKAKKLPEGELFYYIVRRTLQLSCVLLLCAFALLIDAGAYGPATHDVYRLACCMARTPESLLLLGGLGAMLSEALF